MFTVCLDSVPREGIVWPGCGGWTTFDLFLVPSLHNSKTILVSFNICITHPLPRVTGIWSSPWTDHRIWEWYQLLLENSMTQLTLNCINKELYIRPGKFEGTDCIMFIRINKISVGMFSTHTNVLLLNATLKLQATRYELETQISTLFLRLSWLASQHVAHWPSNQRKSNWSIIVCKQNSHLEHWAERVKVLYNCRLWNDLWTSFHKVKTSMTLICFHINRKEKKTWHEY